MSTTTATTIPDPYPVKVHHYPSTSPTSQNRPAQAYEHLPPTPTTPSQKQQKSALIFLGGLGDGPHTIPYVRHLASRLHAQPGHHYSVFEARLSSAFTGFGFGSLAQDAREVADLVRYLRGTVGVQRVVLMGHSTGCQGCLEYGTSYAVGGGEGEKGGLGVRVDGLVLQGPVSDREAIGMGEDSGEVQAALGVAEGMVRAGKGGEALATEVLPAGFRGSPVTAYRWASLAGVGGDDDYFSSDLPDEKLQAVWGALEQPVLILPSEKDEWVPERIDVAGLVKRWKSFCKPGIASELSGLIPAADHRVEDAAAQDWLADRVTQFLIDLEK